MSEPSPSVPPGGQAAARNAAGTGGRLFAFLCWLLLLGAIAVSATVSLIRVDHRAEADRRLALADEQRSVATATATLAEDLAAGAVPAASVVSTLRARALELLARVPPRPVADLQAEWGGLATGLDAIEAEWTRILVLRTGLEALRRRARDLREASDRLADVLVGGDFVPSGRADALVITARQFAGEVDRARLTDPVTDPVADPAGLARARALLDVHARVQGLLTAEIARLPAVTPPQASRTPILYTELAVVDSRLDSAREQLDVVLGAAGAIEPVSGEIRHLAESSARVMELLPQFEAKSARGPAFLGISLDAWILQSAGLAVAALFGLFWRRLRLLRTEAAGLDQAWGEAAESDWRARELVRDLLRVIDSLDRQSPAKATPLDSEDLEGRVREATASLPRIVARRSRLAAALLSAREPLRKRLATARDSVLSHLGPGPGKLDSAPLLDLETTFLEATQFAMAALVREIRAAATKSGPGDADAPGTGEVVSHAHAANGSETFQGTAARAFDLLEAGLEHVLGGEEEGCAAYIFLLDDLRAVRGAPPFSASLDFAPDLAPPVETGSKTGLKIGAVLRADAARMLTPFRKGLTEWATGEGDGDSAARLVRGSVSVLARAAEEGMSPARSFWSAAAAFCTALCERAIPTGPAVRRIMGEVAREFGETAEREEVSPPPDRLLRELLIYVALARSDHAELQAVRTAFELERYPLAIPGHPGATESADGDRPDNVSEGIIQQLEGIRAALDRIDGPTETSPGSSPPR